MGAWWMGHRKMHHPKKDGGAEPTFAMNDRNKGGIFLVKALGLDTLQQKKLDDYISGTLRFFG